MAGVVFGLDGGAWHASSSVFAWALDALAQRSTDAELTRVLREVVDVNLGVLDVEDLTPAQRAELRTAAQHLPDVGRVELPDTPARSELVAQLAELVALLSIEREGRA